MNKGTLGLIVLILVLFFSALFVIVTQAAGEVNSYDPITKTVLIKNSLGNNLLEVQLISNTDQCISECEALLRIKPYAQMTFPAFPDSEFRVDFVEASPHHAGLKSYAFEKRVPYVIADYSEVCNPYNSITSNGTTRVANCTTIATGSHVEHSYEPFNFWGETLEAGKDYYIKLKGSKNIALGENNIEWVPTFYGLQITEWAWWNSNWVRRKPITIGTGGKNATDYQKLLNVSYVTGMKTDFSDLRFTCIRGNGAEEERALNITYKVNSIYADVWLRVLNVTTDATHTCYMYYNNLQAQDGSASFDAVFTKNYDNSTHNDLIWSVHFDEGSGTESKDVSKTAINATESVGTITWGTTDGGYWGNNSNVRFSLGSYLDFNGAQRWRTAQSFDWVHDPNTPGVTLEAWVQLDSVQSGYHDFVNWAGCFGFSKPANNTFSFFFETTGTTCDHIFGPSATTGKWFFFVGTYNGTMAEFWIGYDNKTLTKVAQKAYTGSIQTGSTQWLGDNGVGGNYIDGKLDEVKVYNRSMSYEEILAHFNRRKFMNPEPSATFGSEESLTVNETEGDNAIVQGIVNSVIGPSAIIYTDQQIYIYNLTGNQTLGKFDKIASSGRQRWAFNYVTQGEIFTNMKNLTPSLYILEMANLSTSEITNKVEILINSTKVG